MKKLLLQMFIDGRIKHIQCNYVGQELDNKALAVIVAFPAELEEGELTMEVETPTLQKHALLANKNGLQATIVIGENILEVGNNYIQFVWRNNDIKWSSELFELEIKRSIKGG